MVSKSIRGTTVIEKKRSNNANKGKKLKGGSNGSSPTPSSDIGPSLSKNVANDDTNDNTDNNGSGCNNTPIHEQILKIFNRCAIL